MRCLTRTQQIFRCSEVEVPARANPISHKEASESGSEVDFGQQYMKWLRSSEE